MINANLHKRVEKFVAMTCITTKFLKVNFMLNLESSTNLELAEYQFQLLYSQVNLVSQLLYPKLYD